MQRQNQPRYSSNPISCQMLTATHESHAVHPNNKQIEEITPIVQPRSWTSYSLSRHGGMSRRVVRKDDRFLSERRALLPVITTKAGWRDAHRRPHRPLSLAVQNFSCCGETSCCGCKHASRLRSLSLMISNRATGQMDGSWRQVDAKR